MTLRLKFNEVGAEAKQFIGIGTLNVQTVRGEVKVQSTDWIVTIAGAVLVLPDSIFLLMFAGNAAVDAIVDDRAREAQFAIDEAQARAERADLIEKRLGEGAQVFYAVNDAEALFLELDGRFTLEDGTVVEPSAENRLRWPDAFRNVLEDTPENRKRFPHRFDDRNIVERTVEAIVEAGKTPNPEPDKNTFS